MIQREAVGKGLPGAGLFFAAIMSYGWLITGFVTNGCGLGCIDCWPESGRQQ